MRTPEIMTAFGLTIRSDIAVPEFDQTNGGDLEPVDVTIRREALPPRPVRMLRDGFGVDIGPSSMYFSWAQIGRYLASEGRTILFDQGLGVSDDLARLPIIGVVFAALLSQRGFTVLHASAVQVGGVVVGFIGNKGAGKSTTAGAFHRAGYTVTTDDVLAVRCGEGGYEALPAFPQLKLWPHAAEHIVEDPGELRPLHGRVDKQAFRPSAPLPPMPSPLARLYVLGWGEVTEVELLPSPEALLHVVGHTFTHRFVDSHPMHMPPLLNECSDLMKAVPVRRLKRRGDLADLSEIVRVVLRDLESI